jgi:hypothetical protein
MVYNTQVYRVFGLRPSSGILQNTKQHKQTTNSVALVRKRTIPTERPPLADEVNANFSG